jgi:nicotinamidase-related amidase
MKALVVVDMQEDYIGKISKYKYDDKDLLIQK